MTNKRKRKPKTSQGVHGATKHPLTELQKVLLGKGIYRSLRPVGVEKRDRRTR